MKLCSTLVLERLPMWLLLFHLLGSKASPCNEVLSDSAAITACRIICLYYLFGPYCQASLLLVFGCAVFIRQEPSTLLGWQEVTKHWEAARNGFLNHLSHFQCCVNTAHLLHPKKSQMRVFKLSLCAGPDKKRSTYRVKSGSADSWQLKTSW